MRREQRGNYSETHTYIYRKLLWIVLRIKQGTLELGADTASSTSCDKCGGGIKNLIYGYDLRINK